jgi:hypothetical protein
MQLSACSFWLVLMEVEQFLQAESNVCPPLLCGSGLLLLLLKLFKRWCCTAAPAAAYRANSISSLASANFSLMMSTCSMQCHPDTSCQ